MIRKGTVRQGRKYTLDEVLPFVVFQHKKMGVEGERLGQKREYDGDLINMASDRLKLFAHKGVKCVHCGIEGQYFCKEKTSPKDRSFHFNLYAVSDSGEEILMTKDHILPKKMGGANNLANYQTMCSPCNAEKGSSLEPKSVVVAESWESVDHSLGRLLRTLLRQQRICLQRHRKLDADEVLSRIARGCGVPDTQLQLILDWSVGTHCKG